MNVPSAAAKGSAQKRAGYWFMASVLTLVIVAAIAFAPVVTYRCARAEVGVTCVFSRSVAGLFTIEKREIARVFAAEGSVREVTTRSRKKGKSRSSTSTHHVLRLLGQDGTLLFEDEQRSVAGNSAVALQDAIVALANGSRTEPFRRWQVPWLPWLIASLFLLVLALIVSTIRRGYPEGPLLQNGPVGRWVALVAVGLVLVWVAVLAGHVPAGIARAIGVPGG